MNKKITIIGGGNIGISIAVGLLKSGVCKREDLIVTRRKSDSISILNNSGIHISNDNKTSAARSDILILAVKPKMVETVLHEISPELKSEKHIIISVATGVSIKSMQEMINKPVSIVRIMPNTAIAIQQSMTFIAGIDIKTETKDYILNLFQQLGDAIWIEEELMQAGTALGACGIAYALRFIRAASQGGIEIGFDAQTALRITTQTVKGASMLLQERGLHPEQEIDKVTTPQGYTIAGLNEMEHQGFSSALIKGISVSYNKINK